MAAPVAAFSLTPKVGLSPLHVAFTDASTNTPTSWLWDFGDGSTSTAQNPTHTYATIDEYTVSLIATNADGSDEEEKTDCLAVVAKGPPRPSDKAGLEEYRDIEGPVADSVVLAHAGGLAQVEVITAGAADSYIRVYDGPVGSGELVSHVSGAAIGNRDDARIWLPFGIHVKIVDDDSTLVARISGCFRS